MDDPVNGGRPTDSVPKFNPGHIVTTQGALVSVSVEEMRKALARHLRGDWGELCPEDWQPNDLSLEQGYRLLSVYATAGGMRFYIITEHDRSVTTILLPDEY